MFPPSLPEVPGAPLELYDLDEHFSSRCARARRPGRALGGAPAAGRPAAAADACAAATAPRRHTRLAALTAKCNGTTDEDELAYYISECAGILGVSAGASASGGAEDVMASSRHGGARRLLSAIFAQIAGWKTGAGVGVGAGAGGAEEEGDAGRAAGPDARATTPTM